MFVPNRVFSSIAGWLSNHVCTPFLSWTCLDSFITISVTKDKDQSEFLPREKFLIPFTAVFLLIRLPKRSPSILGIFLFCEITACSPAVVIITHQTPGGVGNSFTAEWKMSAWELILPLQTQPWVKYLFCYGRSKRINKNLKLWRSTEWVCLCVCVCYKRSMVETKKSPVQCSVLSSAVAQWKRREAELEVPLIKMLSDTEYMSRRTLWLEAADGRKIREEIYWCVVKEHRKSVSVRWGSGGRA